MNLSRTLPGGVVLRPVRPEEDARSFCAAQERSREQLRAFEPRRPAEWYEAAFQQERFTTMLAADNLVPWVLADGDQVVGTVTLSNIVHGAWRSGDIGYWVDVAQTGRGLASAAVAAVCELADTELLLHRIAAGTNHDNTRSQRVLLKNGFEQYGFAPRYLHIDGRWRDSNLYQRILNDRDPGAAPA